MNGQNQMMTSSEPQRCVPCPRKIQRQMLASLRRSARCRVNAERRRLSRQILDQIEQQAAQHRQQTDQPVAIRPPAPPTRPAPEPTPPQAKVGQWNRLCSAVQRRFKAVVSRVLAFRSHGRTR